MSDSTSYVWPDIMQLSRDDGSVESEEFDWPFYQRPQWHGDLAALAKLAPTAKQLWLQNHPNVVIPPNCYGFYVAYGELCININETLYVYKGENEGWEYLG